MLTGAILAVIVLSAGYAVNIAQLYNVRSSLRQALDAAVTSTARDITTGRIKADDARGMVELFLKANGDPTFMGGDRLVLDKLIVDKAKSTIEATGYVDVDLYFPLFGLSDERRVTNVSAAVYSDKKVEVAMMLDVTGSMEKNAQTDKIGDLKDAAENAVTAMLSNQDPKNPRVRVAIVPYASGVNVGELADNVYAEQSGKLEPSAACRRSDHRGQEGQGPAGLRRRSFPPSNRPFRMTTTARPSARTRTAIRISPTTARTPCASTSKGKEYYALVNRDNNLSGSGMNKCPEAEDRPADRRLGDAARSRSRTSRRAARRPALSPSSGPTTCCRRNGGRRSRPQTSASGPSDHDAEEGFQGRDPDDRRPVQHRLRRRRAAIQRAGFDDAPERRKRSATT